MEARELRMGNLLYYNGKVIEIDIMPLFFFSKESAFMKKFEDVEPIPLTDEWIKASEEQLLAAGYRIEKQEPGTFTKGGYKLIYTGINPPLLMGSVDFVHKLQNLFFALEDTELEFKTLTPIR